MYFFRFDVFISLVNPRGASFFLYLFISSIHYFFISLFRYFVLSFCPSFFISVCVLSLVVSFVL